MKGLSFAIGGRIEDGKLHVDKAAFAQGYRSWPDCDVTLTLEHDEAKRSSAANRYLWGVVYKHIHQHTGQDLEDIHDEMCARFTAETISYVNPYSGEMVEVEVVRRTSGMKVSQFHTFVERVRLFAAEFFSLTVPDPDPEYAQEQDRAVARESRRSAA